MSINKHLLAIIVVIVAISVNWGCQRRETLIFDESPSQRMQTTIQEALKILPSAPNGWEMRVYPSDRQIYGGFTTFVRFSNQGIVHAASELLEPGRPVDEGYYEINASNGPSIVFNTYNRAIHIYSEPNSRLHVFRGANISEGAGGDYSYQILKVSPDSVILRGAKSRSLIVMTPAKTGNWEESLNRIRTSSTDNHIYYNALTIAGTTINDVEMTQERHLAFHLNGVEYSLPYRYTPTGIELYTPLEIAGMRIQTLDRDYTTKTPTMRSPDGSCTLQARELPLPNHLRRGVWGIDTKTSTGRAQKAIASAKAICNSVGSSLEVMAFGVVHRHPSFGGSLGVWGVINVSNLGMGTRVFHIPVDMEVISETEVKFTYNPHKTLRDNINSKLVQLFQLELLVAPFANIGESADFNDKDRAGRTFRLTTDNPYKPSWILLEDKQEPDNTIKLSRGE
ncbi:MAG: DUF4302 domain-containing protein [Porphyromonadaceae bacterium]|nr:DUF4302 domain-containing protein [Porphyromonadaceae bacterium]